jgi:hypothetical protein
VIQPGRLTNDLSAGRDGVVGVGSGGRGEQRHAEDLVTGFEQRGTGPVASTTPEYSAPRMNGGGPYSVVRPARIAASTGLTPAATTRMRTWLGPESAPRLGDVEDVGRSDPVLGDDTHDDLRAGGGEPVSSCG